MIYIAGNNAVFTSNILKVYSSQANNGDGGMLNFVNTGTNTLSMTDTELQTMYASANGGIGAIAGTSTSITITTFTIDTCKANANHGGGFALTNSLDTTILITSGYITSYCQA